MRYGFEGIKHLFQKNGTWPQFGGARKNNNTILMLFVKRIGILTPKKRVINLNPNALPHYNANTWNQVAKKSHLGVGTNHKWKIKFTASELKAFLDAESLSHFVNCISSDPEQDYTLKEMFTNCKLQYRNASGGGTKEIVIDEFNNIGIDPGRKWISFDLPDNISHMLSNSTNYSLLRFTFNYGIADISTDGMANGNLVVIRTTDKHGNALTETQIAQTVLHEIGHALGLAANGWAEAAGPRTSRYFKNDLYYDEHGGQGNHCSLNTSEDDDGDYEHDGSTNQLCIMYANTDPHVSEDFCPTCATFLKRGKLPLVPVPNRPTSRNITEIDDVNINWGYYRTQ